MAKKEPTDVFAKRQKRLSTNVDYDQMMRVKLLCVGADITYEQLIRSLFAQLLDGKLKLPEGDAKNQTHLDL